MAHKAPSLQLGSLIAETYELRGVVGVGGMGEVYEASHRRLPGRRVAIKVLRADVSQDPDAMARFRREAEVTSALAHPNIVAVHDFDVMPDGRPFLVLELLVGESLDKRIRRGPLELPDALRITRQIAAGLASAHEAGVVHRDLKPANVFLCQPRGEEDERVKVLDFGISKIQGSQTIQTLEAVALGTPQYMSPEQALGHQAEVDGRTDVFALGLILYEMLVGRTPFRAASVPEIVFKTVYEAQRPLAELDRGVPPRVSDAVERALAKAPGNRFATVNDLAEALTGEPLRSSGPRGAARSSTPPAAVLRPAATEPATRPQRPSADGTGPAVAEAAGARSEDDATAPTRVPGVQMDAVALAPPPEQAGPAPTGRSPVLSARSVAAPPPRSRAGRVAAAAVLVAIAAGGATALLLGGRDDAPAAPPRSTALSAGAPGAASPAAAPGPAAAVDAGAGLEPMPAPHPQPHPTREPDRDATAASAPPAGREPAVRPKPRRLPTPTAPSAADAALPVLAAGEAALRAGDFAGALRLADRAIGRTPDDPRGHVLRARAYCGMEDLGNARASLRNVPRGRRPPVERFCREHGVEL